MKIIRREYEVIDGVPLGEYLAAFNPFRTVYWSVASIEADFVEIAEQPVMMKFYLLLADPTLSASSRKKYPKKYELPIDLPVESISTMLKILVEKKEARIVSYIECKYLPYLDCLSVSQDPMANYADLIYIRNTKGLSRALNDYLEFRSLNKYPLKEPKVV